MRKIVSEKNLHLMSQNGLCHHFSTIKLLDLRITEK